MVRNTYILHVGDEPTFMDMVATYLLKESSTDQYAGLANRLENAVEQQNSEQSQRERKLEGKIGQLAEIHDWELQIGESTEGGARFEITSIGRDPIAERETR